MLTLAELSKQAISQPVRDALLDNISKFKDWAGEFQIHHVVTRDAVKNSEFIREVYGVDRYAERFNSAENLIALPTNGKDAVATGLSQHLGNHPGYQEAVKKFERDLYNDFLMASDGKSGAELEAIKENYRKFHLKRLFAYCFRKHKTRSEG